MAGIDDPVVIGQMLKATPGGCDVTQGGVTTGGHLDVYPDGVFNDQGIAVADALLEVPAEALPDVCVNPETGKSGGQGETVTVKKPGYEFEWVVRGVREGTAPGQITLLLANR